MKNHYKTLNLKENATQYEIHKSYRRLCKIYHPDIFIGGGKEKQIKLNKAYAILSDPEKRKIYDNNGDQKQISLSIDDLIKEVIKEVFVEIIKSNFEEIDMFQTAQNLIKVEISKLKQERQKVQDNIDHVTERIIMLKDFRIHKVKENMSILAEVTDEEISKLEELISNSLTGKLDKDILVNEEALRIVTEDYPIESAYYIRFDMGY